MKKRSVERLETRRMLRQSQGKRRVSDSQKSYPIRPVNAKIEQLGCVYDGRDRIGSVVAVCDGFRALDTQGATLGDFPTLRAAMAAVGRAQ